MLFSFVSDWHKYVEQKGLSQVVHKALHIQINKLEKMTDKDQTQWSGSGCNIHGPSFIETEMQIFVCHCVWFNGHQWVFIYHGKSLETLLGRLSMQRLCYSAVWIIDSLPVISVMLQRFIGMNAEGLEMSFSMGGILFWASIRYTALFLQKRPFSILVVILLECLQF